MVCGGLTASGRRTLLASLFETKVRDELPSIFVLGILASCVTLLVTWLGMRGGSIQHRTAAAGGAVWLLYSAATFLANEVISTGPRTVTFPSREADLPYQHIQGSTKRGHLEPQQRIAALAGFTADTSAQLHDASTSIGPESHVSSGLPFVAAGFRRGTCRDCRWRDNREFVSAVL